MKVAYETVRQSTKRLPHLDLVGKGRLIAEKLTDNPHFPDPSPTIPELLQACTELAYWTDLTNFNRGRLEMEARNTAYMQLRQHLLVLGAYVQTMSHGDGQVIMSAGFDVRIKRQPSQQLPAPQNVVALRTLHPGCLDVRWAAVKNRRWYEVQINAGDPNDPAAWHMLLLTSKNYARLTNLQSDREYYCRIVAHGALGASPVSDISSAKAA